MKKLEDRASEVVRVYLTRREKARLAANARKRGMSMSKLLRDEVRKIAP